MTCRLPEKPGHAPRKGLGGALCDEAGSVLIEMAVSLPVFFMLALGLVNFALIMFGVCNITYASRYVDRYACLHSSTSYVPATTQGMTNMALPYIFRYPSNTYSTGVNYSGSSGNGNVLGNTVTVTITVTYNIVLPFYTYNGLKISSSAAGTIIQ